MTLRSTALASSLAFVSAAGTGVGCVYDWSVGRGGSEPTGSSESATSGTTGSSGTSGSSASTGIDCGALVAQYRAALLAAKRCVMTDPTGCQLADDDDCGCKVFLDRASPEASAFDAKKAQIAASGCSLGCTACGVGPVIGSCAVDLTNGGTSCAP